MLLPGEETKEPCDRLENDSGYGNCRSYLNRWCVVRSRHDRIYRTPSSLWKTMQ
jgi:hypothetical protein